MRYCTHPRCRTLVHRGRCPTHQAQTTQVQARFSKGNYGRPWRRRRQQFLDDSYPWYCAIRSPVCTARDRLMEPGEIEVDHVIPHRGDITLRDDPTNLQVACKACHSLKTSREVEWKSQRNSARA